MSIMAHYHLPITEHMIGQRKALHANMALGKHTRSNDVGHSIQSYPLGSTHREMMSDMTCHLFPWTAAHDVGRRKAWHSIITIGQHKRSNNVMFDMPSSTLDSTRGGKTLSVEYHNCLWIAYMVRIRRAWNAIIALAPHTRSDYVRHGRHSLPLGSIHGHGMLSSPLDRIHGRTTLGIK
uniref:Uncharacterized protein n=1 Tax=Solanum lycopersicum TaxID=4081 RepID=A0A494G8I0_SOLLC